MKAKLKVIWGSISVLLWSIVVICISFSWIVIHLHTIGYMATLELSPVALRYGVAAMGVSGLSLPVYLLVKLFKKGVKDGKQE